MIRYNLIIRDLLGVVITLSLGTISGCAPLPAAAVDLSAGPQPTATIYETIKQTPFPLEIAFNEPSTSHSEVNPVDLSGPLPPVMDVEPLHFTFPTPAADFISAWRPPLVPVPWALTPYDHFLFIRPIKADNVNWPSADYRYGDFFPDTTIVHTGVDIAADRGTPVIAAASGKVTWAGVGLFKGGDSEEDPYGIAAAIRHDFGYGQDEIYTIYAHMDRVDVEVGQRVEIGDHVGIVGDTGKATGPHLHFGVRIRGNSFFTSRNPELWLAPPQGWGVLVGRLSDRYGQPLPKIAVRVTSIETGNTWTVRTYGPTSVNGDDYYHENLVLSDLPAGEYRINFRVRWKDYQHFLTINPGMVTFINFDERPGVFSDVIPEIEPELIFKPALDK